MTLSSIHTLVGALYPTYSFSYIQVRFLGHEITNLTGLLAVAVIFVISRLVKLINGMKAVSFMPGMCVPFQPLGVPGSMLPTSWWNPGLRFPWLWRTRLYKDYQSESISVVAFISGIPGIYTCNLDVARQVIAGAHKTSFIKPKISILLLWGTNLVTADGEVWRKHRRIIGSAFNNSLYQMVWTETLQTYREMVAVEGWMTKDIVDVPVIQALAFKLALLVIGKCGFGFSFNWYVPPIAPDGTMSVQEAFYIVVESHMFAIFAPKWIQSLPFRRFRKIREAHNQLTEFMRAQIADRRADIRGSDTSPTKNDLFTMLVMANEEESGKLKLSDQELLGNVFMMLFSGHETTAHTLAATLGFLSIHEDIQEEASKQIIAIVGHDRDPILDDYPKLDRVLAVFYEALRLFPTVHVMIREAYEDTVLHIPNPPGQEGSTAVPVLKGTQVIVDMVGVQYNPRYFDNPYEYRPSRWHSAGATNESEAFSAFSTGPRKCIGRKFATVESVAFLTMLLRDWSVHPILRDGETKGQWRERILDAKQILTLGVADIPLRFIRRKRS